MLQEKLIQEISNGEYEKFVKEGLTLVCFFKDWCMNCLMMEPIFEEVSEKFLGRIKFAKINVEENRDFAKKMKIGSTPHFLMQKNGIIIGSFYGTSCVEEFEERVRGFL